MVWTPMTDYTEELLDVLDCCPPSIGCVISTPATEQTFDWDDGT